MAEVSNKRCKGSSSSVAFPSGESSGLVKRPSVDGAYPTGMGLRPKACPRSRNATVATTRDDRTLQGPVDRCLTLVRTMNIDTTGDDSRDPADQMDTSVGAQNTSTTDPDVGRPEPRPGQSACRNRAQSGWDVMPFVVKCGMPCLTCGAPCNRTLGRHFIRLADDNPAHLCFHHDLHELYDE